MKIEDSVYEILKQCSINDDGTLLYLPKITLDRKLYLKTNKVIESFGYKWNRSQKCHINPNDVSEKFYNMLDAGEWLDIKKELQFFPTPKEIVNEMIGMIDWQDKMLVLEPSCGKGNIAHSLPDRELNIDCVEINTDILKECVANKPHNSNSYDFMFLDFMEYPYLTYDVIIANPPFSKFQDIKHFNKMKDMLRNNGQLVCVLSAGSYDTNSSIKLRRDFSEFVDEFCDVMYLDNGTFKESRTNVSAIIVKYVNEVR